MSNQRLKTLALSMRVPPQTIWRFTSSYLPPIWACAAVALPRVKLWRSSLSSLHIDHSQPQASVQGHSLAVTRSHDPQAQRPECSQLCLEGS